MTAWIHEVTGSLNAEQRAVADGLVAEVERLDPAQLDAGASSAVADENGFHITLAHRHRPEFNIVVDAGGHGEVVVSYGHEHETFRSEDAEVGRVWPFPSEDHVQATLALVGSLLTGRVELHVWKRLLGVKTRSYWINEDGQPELFLRGFNGGPFFGWSRTPQTYRFDFMEAASPQ